MAEEAGPPEAPRRGPLSGIVIGAAIAAFLAFGIWLSLDGRPEDLRHCIEARIDSLAMPLPGGEGEMIRELCSIPAPAKGDRP